MAIDTAAISDNYRARIIDTKGRRLLLTDFTGSLQERDLTDPPNCGGLGRVRHFCRRASSGWPLNGLPIDPACKALHLPAIEMIRAQAFQVAACNWRCWYCFVPFDLLKANPKHAAWISPAEMIDRYLAQSDPPPIIDLTGGEPSLIPEWTLWMMQELKDRKLERNVYLWSDDNLSNDFFWKFLTADEREFVATYPTYGHVCCFKGFNSTSFAFNTAAEPSFFDLQFSRAKRLIDSGLDVYAYVTLTTPSRDNISRDIRDFVDRLQDVGRNLPLRTVPLEIRTFTPVQPRMNAVRQQAMEFQQVAIEAWKEELASRFRAEERAQAICNISLGKSHET